MDFSKQKIKKVFNIIIAILLVVYFIKALWVNISSYDKVKKVPQMNVETREMFMENQLNN